MVTVFSRFASAFARFASFGLELETGDWKLETGYRHGSGELTGRAPSSHARDECSVEWQFQQAFNVRGAPMLNSPVCRTSRHWHFLDGPDGFVRHHTRSKASQDLALLGTGDSARTRT